MERGSLDSALYSPDRSVRDEYSWARRGAKIVLDAAKGLRYLHALRPPIVHFDLKPANVLISADHVGKLSDVGGAKHCANTLTRALSLTQLYASPELRNDAVAGPPADVYSFGVMIHEVYRGQRPPPPAQRPFVLKKEWAVTPLLKRIGGRSDTGALCRVPARRPTAAAARLPPPWRPWRPWRPPRTHSPPSHRSPSPAPAPSPSAARPPS
mmetsp:Transcript_68780/g.206286  ORF Transcript_68780/g.206286 Transcript_68780/m.206286 type:complete len:211 (-) Transcript_68780:435-1067(-)